MQLCVVRTTSISVCDTMRVLALIALFAGASALSFDANDKAWKVNPVTKVVNMLKEMQADLQHEADNETELYEKMTCYCDSNEKEKTKAIGDAENHSAELTSTIESNKAKSASLTTEVETLAKEIKANNA